MWSLLYGRGTIDVERMADRYTAMVLHGVIAPGGSAVDAAEPAATAVPTDRDDIERRLARLERIVAAGSLPAAEVPPAVAKRRKATP
jgi:hypothetical protein